MKLSKVAVKKFRGITKDKFREKSMDIADKIELYNFNGLDFDEWERQVIAENDQITQQFLRAIEDRTNPASLDLFAFFCQHFLDEFRWTHGKRLSTVNEVELVEQLFDRFPRKMAMPVSEKLAALKALKVMFHFFYQQELVSLPIYRFVTLLSQQQEFFRQRIKNPASSFFWEVGLGWKEHLHQFEIKQLKLCYKVQYTDLDPLPYISTLESKLTDILVDDQLQSWRELRWKKGVKLRDLQAKAHQFTNTWYTTPKIYLEHLTPLDWITMERHFTDTSGLPF